jgi:4-amino-4-deoxy-L-arabinose transferase-like glycosyltransferase
LLLIGLAIVDLRKRKDRQSLSPETLWLICWSLGGLLVMSLIPSKRVDRIFPVIPPMCLLIAAQLRGRNLRWATAALLLSILYAGGYSAFKVYTGYRDHRGALVGFGAMVRDEAARHEWRYEVVKTNDEGLLLYLGKLHFVPPAEAIARWERGELDALVGPDNPNWLHSLQPAPVHYSIAPREEQRSTGANYVLYIR